MNFNKKLKAVLLAAMFATAGLVSQTAAAANPVFDVEYDADGGFSGGIYHLFTAPTPSFTDYFSFEIGTGFSTSTSITSTFTQVGSKTKDVDITAFNLVKYDPLTAAVLSTIYGTNLTDTSVAHPTDSWTLSASGLTAGSYYVQVIGKVTGTSGGSYGGDISVLAVPEPETYALLLGGLGMVGFVARRKAAKKAA